MKLAKFFIMLVCGLLLFCGIAVQAQTNPARTYQTAFTNAAPDIDGYATDSCWNKVEWSGNFIQNEPAENKPPSQQTSFKILYDNNNLYVLIRAFDSEPDKISRIMSRRDNFSGDLVEINIDSYYDKQTAFSFTASASGVKGDEAVSANGNNWDASWNPIWYLKTSIDDQGWCAEMRIPLSQLRFGNKQSHIWGIQVMRYIHRLQERSLWQFIPKGSPGMIHLFGELQGIENIKPKKQIELMPYTVASAERFKKEEGNPFMDGKSTSLSGGIDGKVALSNDFTLDFSVNPDFGQVEADPSEVNLTAFESYFSERRPFFVEGKSIYQFQPSNTYVIGNMGSDNLFYSRRIGRYPHYKPDNDERHVKMPESTSILGAAKVSGKTQKGLSVGILESLASAEYADIDSAGKRWREKVEPLTNFFAARVQQDFNKGKTVLGGMFTAVNRDINSSNLDNLHSAAYTGGIDFQHNWKDRTWYVAGNAVFSNVRGKEEAITNTQRASAHYFQRPGADYISVDSSLKSLSGYGSTIKFGRTSKQRIRFETSVSLRSPGLEFNDIGFMRSSDIIHHGSWVGYQIRDPFSIFNNFYLNSNYWMYWNFGGDLLSKHANINFNTQFKNKWGFNGSFTRNSENISMTHLRGGSSFTLPGSIDMNINVNSPQSKKVTFYAGTYLGLGDSRSYHGNEYWAGITVRPFNSLSVSLDPSYSRSNNKLQYIKTADLSSGSRYVFGSLDQKTVNFTFRVNFTINPELSVEYYGQPFISDGKYEQFKVVSNPNSDAFVDRYHVFAANEISYNKEDEEYYIYETHGITEDYKIDNPNFNFRQFRSNLVIRWEYLPGSTLFLVWSQGRTSEAKNGDFSYRNDMRGLFHTFPHNVFLIKLSYWFSM